MSWFTSWIPELPQFNFAVPASIQGRFISFILKKTLGHFLKPGQFDPPQIDSQIGSGYVQISDLELDTQTIDSYLHDFPVRLHTGTISLVKVRIPWPNPLSSTLGFSVKSLHLVFHLAPPSPSTNEQMDLSDSVASVAHSFVEEELSAQEDAALWNSLHHGIHQSQDATNLVPGDFSGTSNVDPIAPSFEADPAGVSVFAGLIERLLAKFEFDVEDMRITIVHPGNISLSLSVAQMQYSTRPTSTPSASMNTSDPRGETRTLSINGICLSACNLYSAYTPFPRSSGTPTPLSRMSSSSSIDEQTHLAMSQSLAFLPPANHSPTSSASSSMYESAISTAPLVELSSPRQSEEELLTESVYRGDAKGSPSPDRDHEVIFSFGSQPIVLELSTPAAVPSQHDDPFITVGGAAETKPDLQASLSAGVLAFLIRPWQVHGLSRLCQALPASGQRQTAPQKDVDSGKVPPMELRSELRSVVVLLVPAPSDTGVNTQDFFSKPLVPPSWNTGYTRLHLDSLRSNAHFQQGSQTVHFSLEDISVFSFIPYEEAGLRAVPILVTDWNLCEQYPRHHFQPKLTSDRPSLPALDDLDWSDASCASFGVRLARWRSQPSASNRFEIPRSDAKAFTVSITQGKSVESQDESGEGLEIVMDVAPLHARLHFGQLLRPGGPLAFFEDLLPSPISDGSSVASESTIDQYHPVARVPPKKDETPEVQGKARPTISINLSLLRLSLRCPPPPSCPVNRSGSIVLDVQSATITTAAPSRRSSTRFADEDSDAQRLHEYMMDNVVLQGQFNRVLVAISQANSSKAVGLVSIGALGGPWEVGPGSNGAPENLQAIRPKVSFMQRKELQSSHAVSAISIELPGIYVDISKAKLDALQYWVDDLTQFFERVSAPQESQLPPSGNTSIVGSRFFVNSRAGSTLSASRGEAAETVIKIAVTEGFVNAALPRADLEDGGARPFVIECSDIDLLVELNPERKHQTVITVGITDITIEDTKNDFSTRRFLVSTPAKSLSTRKPVVKLRVSSSTLPVSNTKETKIAVTLSSFALSLFLDTQWTSDLMQFGKNPPGTFESVVPNDRTRISLKISDGSLCVFGVTHPGALVVYIQAATFSTDVIEDSDDSSFQLSANEFALLFVDHVQDYAHLDRPQSVSTWTTAGFALLAEVGDLNLQVIRQVNPREATKVLISRILLRIHLCADTVSAITPFFADIGSNKSADVEEEKPPKEFLPTVELAQPSNPEKSLMSSVDDLAFKKVPAVGSAPDMIYDDLPTNTDYLDESFGAAAGLREILDEDVDEFDQSDYGNGTGQDDPNIISRVGGETIKLFDGGRIDPIEDYYLNVAPDKTDDLAASTNSDLSIRVQDGHVNLFLYDGYDWSKTRKTIEEEVKGMRKRLLKIRQLVATGQMQDSTIEDTSALLYNSVRIGLLQDEDALAEPAALIAAIDEELNDDFETSSQSSWQSLRPAPNTSKAQPKTTRTGALGRRLTRSKTPSIEFSLSSLKVEFDKYRPDDPQVSRTFVTVKDLEILDHIKTSTWKKFLTELRSDSRGNIRETGSDMVRVEIRGVRPVSGNAAEEVRLRAKLLPLRLYVDQDAVDFLKKFFSFQDPDAPPSSSDENGAFIQLGEIFPIDLKLDYKPRRVDYRALKEGRTIELMNFFHFDGAEMTLRHITLAGVTGWGKFFEMLNDLWTPDVKATQLVEVISGVAPIRSVVNVGSGVADLILLPIAQYKKDGRVVRGVQKGATSFVKSTAVEAIKMGAKLATGTQVILEQAEELLGGRFDVSITGDPVQVSSSDDVRFDDVDEEATAELISKYAQQPGDLKEGVQFAYKSLQRNLSSAAQTILAVPMEVYERSGNEGPVRSVIRAVPIAVLKPMIGASEAVSKTLLGLHNTLDPNVRLENEAKYK